MLLINSLLFRCLQFQCFFDQSAAFYLFQIADLVYLFAIGRLSLDPTSFQRLVPITVSKQLTLLDLKKEVMSLSGLVPRGLTDAKLLRLRVLEAMGPGAVLRGHNTSLQYVLFLLSLQSKFFLLLSLQSELLLLLSLQSQLLFLVVHTRGLQNVNHVLY